MKTYLGPWQWGEVGGESGWLPPAGCLGAVDLRTLPQMSQSAGAPGIGCFVTSGVLPSEYTLLADGDPAEAKTTGKLRAAWASVAGFAAEGDTLDRLLLDHLTRGSDPDGLSAPKPLMPSRHGRAHWLDLHLHRRVRSRPFVFGEDAEDTERVRALLRREFRALMRDANAGKLKDRHHHLRVLDFWCEQHSIADWCEFVPADLRADVPGRLKHETTLNEAWPTNGTTISSGQNLTWTETSGDLEVRSGRLGEVGEAGYGEARAEHDLSSADHYAQCAVYDMTAPTVGSTVRVITRFSASARTHYGYYRFSDGSRTLFKRIAGAITTLSASGAAPPADGTLIKCEVSGSSLIGYDNGSANISTTDTSISGGVRCGAACQINGEQDAWEASDLSAGGILFTQLERTPRGIMRGTWLEY